MGASDSIRQHITELGGPLRNRRFRHCGFFSRTGGTASWLSDGPRVLGVIRLKDVVKGGMEETFCANAR